MPLSATSGFACTDSDLRPLQCAGYPVVEPQSSQTSRSWLFTDRPAKPPHVIPRSTHISGQLTRANLLDCEDWPNVRLVEPSDLQAKALRIFSPVSGEYEPATLLQAIPYLADNMRKKIPYSVESCRPAGEEDVRKETNTFTYQYLFDIANHWMKKDSVWGVMRHWHLPSPAFKMPDASESDPEKLYKTFADQVFILHHKEGPDPKDKEQNEWLRPGQVDLNSVPIAWQKALKCALLLVEFKAISTNVDPPNSKVKEWELVVNKAAIAREKKENRRRGIRSRSSGEPYLRPDGRKAKIIFAQALAYSQAHWCEDMIVDDYTAPKVLRFEYEPGALNVQTKGKPLQMPKTATLSHLAESGQLKDGQINLHQAAVFLLADAMCQVGCTWLARDIPNVLPPSSGPVRTGRSAPNTGPYTRSQAKTSML